MSSIYFSFIKVKEFASVVSIILLFFCFSEILLFSFVKILFGDEKFSSLDFLKTNDTQIKIYNGKGNCVYLRGTNIGNPFVQESWISPTDAKEQKAINSALEERFGKDGKDSLIDHYENAYLTTKDFNNFKELGMSVIRIPFTYMNFYSKNSK